MADAVEIRITASNGASQVFRAIQGDADKLGKSLTDAGRDGDKAFDQIDKGARDAERSVRSMGDRVQGAADTIDGMAVGLTALGGALVYAGRSAMEQERQIIALNRAWGDAADEMLAFAEQMDAATIFSDDDIRAGERFFVTLRENYDLSIQQIQDLMQTTADLASAAGITYEDASSRITAAIRGEGEAAEYLGLTMNQQSIDRENLTLSMTNQEAAQFRLNALNEQAAIYQGTAADVAASSIGTYANLQDTMQDLAQSVGAFIGPWGSVISGLGLGLAGVTSLVGGLGRMVTAMRTSTIASTAFRGATSGLSLAFNPLTLGIGAVVAAGVDLYSFYKQAKENAEETAASIGVLTDEIERLKLAEQGGLASELQGIVDDLNGIKDLNTVPLEDLIDFLNLPVDTTLPQILGGPLRDELDTSMGKLTEFTDHISEVYNSLSSSEAKSAYLQYVQDMLDSVESTVEGTNLDDIISEVITTPASEIPGVMDAVSTSTDKASSSMGTFTASLTGVASGAEALLSIYGDLATGIPTVTERIESMAEANDKLTVSVTEGADALASVFGGADFRADSAATQIALITDNAGTAAEKLGSMGERGAESATEMADAFAEANDHLIELTTEGSEGLQSVIDSIREARQEFIATGMEIAGVNDALSQINLTSLANDATRVAENIQTGGDALDNTFRIIVGNTNAIQSQMDSVNKWALDLINVEGEYGKIDDLLNAGIITLQTYNEAQAAQWEITQSTAQTQEWLLSIQAQQAPLIAQLTEQQENYVEQLSRMPEQQQLIALGWMDNATAAQAAEITTLAAAAANDEYGASGRAMVEQVVQGAVAANPVLGEMLEQMGLISIGADGTITIDFGSVKGAKSEIAQLTDSIDALTVAMGGIPPARLDVDADLAQTTINQVIDALNGIDGTEAQTAVLGDNSDALASVIAAESARDNIDGTTATTFQLGAPDNALDAISSVSSNLAGLDGDSATVSIYALDYAGGVIGSVANALWNLDGASATVTTYQNTVYSTIGPHMMTGGTVWADQPNPSRWGGLAAANGRTVMVGEAGPELVTLPNGAQVTPHGASMSRLEGMGGAMELHLHMHAPVYGIDDFTAKVFEIGAPALAAAVSRQERGQGVMQ